MNRRLLRWDTRSARLHWREDAALGFAGGLAVAGQVLPWLGLR